jgi:hypothetical protein
MYNIYTDTELINRAPSISTARNLAITAYKSLQKEIFVWREQKGKKSELVLEVLHDETQ